MNCSAGQAAPSLPHSLTLFLQYLRETVLLPMAIRNEFAVGKVNRTDTVTVIRPVIEYGHDR